MTENENEKQIPLAKEEDILTCLKARISGKNIIEANKYISKIEVTI